MICNRLIDTFDKIDHKALTIYFTAGYPSLDSTVDIITTLADAGVDIIEVGMPYSDPLADGPVIQKSSQAALKNGMNLEILFLQLAEARKRVSVPLILMGYYNQVLQYGIEPFCAKASEAGVDGLILPDLPIEEFKESCEEIFDRYELTVSFLVTPISTDHRIKILDECSSGFLYAVTSNSITGGKSASQLEDYAARLKKLSLKNPIQMGFGVKDAESFTDASTHVDGAIIGTAFINAIDPNNLIPSIKNFVLPIVEHRSKSKAIIS